MFVSSSLIILNCGRLSVNMGNYVICDIYAALELWNLLRNHKLENTEKVSTPNYKISLTRLRKTQKVSVTTINFRNNNKARKNCH